MANDRRGPPGGNDPDATIPVHRPSAAPSRPLPAAGRPPPQQVQRLPPQGSQPPRLPPQPQGSHPQYPQQPPGSQPGGEGPRGTYRMPAPDPSGAGLDMPESWDVRSRQGAPRAPMPGMPPAPPPARTSRLTLVLGVAAVLAATAGAAAIAWHYTSPAPAPRPEPTGEATPPANSATPDPGAASAATSDPTATAVASSSASASAAAKPAAPPDDELACFSQLMPGDAFGDTEPDLKQACTGRRAYPTTLVLKSAVVAAGGTDVTDAMREWSKLGWFETAAFAAMRAHCCPDAKALTVSNTFAVCQLEEALAYVTNAIDDDEKMAEALKEYESAIMCLTRRGWANAFGRGGPPYGGEKAHFERIMSRIKKARGH